MILASEGVPWPPLHWRLATGVGASTIGVIAPTAAGGTTENFFLLKILFKTLLKQCRVLEIK
jgi:hypothetical protein